MVWVKVDMLSPAFLKVGFYRESCAGIPPQPKRLRYPARNMMKIPYSANAYPFVQMLFFGCSMSANHIHGLFEFWIAFKVEIDLPAYFITNPDGIVRHDFGFQRFEENRLVCGDARFCHEERLRFRAAVRSRRDDQT